MCAGRHDAAGIHHQNHVGFLHGGHALGDDDLRGVRNLVVERGTDQLVRLGIDGAGRIVENQNLRLLQQRTGDAQALALSAGHIGTALLDVRVVLIGEFLNESIGLRELRGMANLFIGGVRVAPAQVFGNSAGEQHVLLQHHGHLIAQRLNVIVAHVHAADLERARAHVVESRHQLH